MRLSVFIVYLAVLVGCSSEQASVLESAENTSSSSSVEAVSTSSSYVPYTERGVDASKGAILFFAKTGDPFSDKNHLILTSLYASENVSVPTYRVDFASFTGARLQYAVIVPDTFVLLDASKTRIATFLHPSKEEISIIVRGRLPLPSSSSSL
jgi:hypothetical protein